MVVTLKILRERCVTGITNMRVLRKSRRSPKPGDIFAFQIEEGRFHFGRVIRLDARIGPVESSIMENCVLLYLYKAASEDKHHVPELKKHELLVPPILTSFLPWVEGHFETVEHRPPRENDVLPVHCFLNIFHELYFDESGNRLPQRSEPCGEYALQNPRTIDDAVSEALGIPLAPEFPEVGEGCLVITMTDAELAEAATATRIEDALDEELSAYEVVLALYDALDETLSKAKLGHVSGLDVGAKYNDIEVTAADANQLGDVLSLVKTTLQEFHVPGSVRIYLPGGKMERLCG